MSARAHGSTQRRYRVAPRSRTRTRRSRIDWERASRIALVLVFFLIVALYVNPVASFFDALQESKAERANLAELEQANAELKARVAVLEEPDGVEREARRTGMVGEAERPYVVRNLRDK